MSYALKHMRAQAFNGLPLDALKEMRKFIKVNDLDDSVTDIKVSHDLEAPQVLLFWEDF